MITSNAGKDATALFAPIHPKDIVQRLLPPSHASGLWKKALLSSEDVVAGKKAAPPRGSSNKVSDSAETTGEYVKPPLDQMLNIFDFESVAANVMTEEGWGYYSSGADDEITLRENHTAFQRVWFKPRVLVNVKEVDISSKILGCGNIISTLFHSHCSR